MSFPFSTLPGLALYAGALYKNPAALGYKRNGRWRKIPSAVFLDSVRRAGECLIEMGLKPGDKVGISADSSPFWLMADLAALGAGAVTVPLFPNAARETLRHQIEDSGMKFLFVGSGELRDSFQTLCGAEVSILVLSPRLVNTSTTGHDDDEDQLGAQESDGSSSGPRGVQMSASPWDARALTVRPEDTATMIYTSGSTGHPKGVELTHANLVSQVQAARLRFPLDPATDSALSFLPLSHVFERMVAYFYIASGVSLHFAEDPKLAGENLRELHPTLMTVVPRFLEKAHDRIVENAQRGGLSGKLAQAAMKRAFERLEFAAPTLMDRLYDHLVYRRIRQRMGGKLRLVICGSAPLDARLCRFFLNTGLQVYEGYGLTESSPVLSVNYPRNRKLGTVGKAFPGVELRLAPDGEVLARGPNLMKGYFKHPEATRDTIDEDGWLHTGDLGRFDQDGYLTITGRKKELFKTANGKYVAPLPIEQALVAHKLVEAAVIIADGRPYATVVIFPDFDELVAWRNDLSEKDETVAGGAFLRSQAVLDRYASIVASVNESISPWERMHRFALADAPASIEGGELTPTMKLRRHAVEAKYAAKIEAMYGK
jgi:long-chain acyl-CoA synthetase